MNLVKWLRKNNTKIMAVVVIVIMIGFIGGSSLSYLLRSSGGINQTVAYYGDKIKIKRSDLIQAQNEMEVLKMLQTGNILKMLQIPLFQTPDFHALMLGELLFTDQRPSQEVLSYVKQTASRYQYRIGNPQIDDMYNRTVQSYVHWYLLYQEAENAGFRVSIENSRTLLTQAIPSLFGQDYALFMQNILDKNTLSEQQILSIFSKLLAILRYSHSVCSDEDITNRQLKHILTWQEEGIDVEFVEFNSDDFIDEQEEPGETQITNHFEQYKKYFPDEITEDNPYGFGYMLPERVQIEYLAVKLDDIKKTVTEPTFDDLEEFYNNNKETYTEQVPSNPDDPNSDLITRTKAFSEMADTISEQLLQEKTNAKSNSIIQEARNLADTALQDYNDTELSNFSLEERAELAGDYKEIVTHLSSKYGIDIYTGITGELSAVDIRNDKYLSSFYVEGYVNRLGIAQIAFAVDEIKTSQLGSYETVRPRMFESIAPVKDASEQIIASIRIVESLKAMEPENINESSSKITMVFDPNDEDDKEYTFSVKENVIKDLKKLSAMETAKTRADEFLGLVASNDIQDWENAVDKFNELHGSGANDPNDPNSIDNEASEEKFSLENLTALRRLSKATLDTMEIQAKGDPAFDSIVRERKKGALFVEELFSLAQNDPNNNSDFEPSILEFTPGLSYYVVRNVTINNLWREDFENFKPMSAYTEDHVKSQSMSLAHYNPGNIIDRMNFRFLDVDNENSEESDSQEQ